MTTPDNIVLEPDVSQDESELIDVTEKPQHEVDYGILIYIDKEGEQGLQIVGRQNATLIDLLGLLELGQRKLHLLWDSKHNPATQAIFREMDSLKKLGVQNSKTLQAIGQILYGLRDGLKNIHSQTDKHIEEADVAATKDPIQAE